MYDGGGMYVACEGKTVIDPDGFRPNVGIVLCDADGHVLWARRVGQDAWQFPQGGIQENESADAALYRELEEELGLMPADVCILGSTEGWLRYRLPESAIRPKAHQSVLCIGQKQKWYLLRLVCDERKIRLDASKHPEFDSWRWVEYWYPIDHIVDFKKEVYTSALKLLSSYIK